MHRVCYAVLSAMLLPVGCAAPPEPEPVAARITLYAIRPTMLGSGINAFGEEANRLPDPGHDPAGGLMHGYEVLGRVDLSATELGEVLAEDLAFEADAPRGPIAGCFEPRHALRVQRGGRATDYLLCFACAQFDWYVNDKPVRAGKQTLPAEWRGRFTDPLTDAGIELAE